MRRELGDEGGVEEVRRRVALDRKLGGLGLGLTLVKGLVEMHGGSVSAESAGLGSGAEFIVRLPLDTTASAEACAAEGEPRPRGQRRVLIIEDNVDAADSLREVIEQLGENVVEVAYDGRGGVELAHGFQPDLVLCDIGLPSLNGYDVARALRADSNLRRRPELVALTGYVQSEDAERAKEAGFDQYLAKPPSPERLEQVLAGVAP